jgi:hypothetical protein
MRMLAAPHACRRRCAPTYLPLERLDTVAQLVRRAAVREALCVQPLLARLPRLPAGAGGVKGCLTWQKRPGGGR